MRNHSVLPMDEVDIHLLSDIIEHFFGQNRESAKNIRDELETAQKNYNPSFPNDEATDIISDLTKIVQRAEDSLEVAECTTFTPTSDVESNFLELSVKEYVKMKRDYFEETHNPNR